jgi:NAD(P)H-dependent FMN reductase
MIRIAVIVGSTRPGRRGEAVARWVKKLADQHVTAVSGDVTFELVDLADYRLPMLDEASPAMLGQYAGVHTVRWAETIRSFDGFVFVTPEYNHSAPAALKNALDYLFAEWNDKAAGFVSYGVHGGTRAVEHLRLTLGELKVADVRSQVALSMFTDFEITDPTEPGLFRPGSHHERTLHELLDEVVAWSQALAPLRAMQPAGV